MSNIDNLQKDMTISQLLEEHKLLLQIYEDVYNRELAFYKVDDMWAPNWWMGDKDCRALVDKYKLEEKDG